MSNQAQVEALEHLLIAVLNSSITTGVPKDYLLETAKASLLGSDGPGNPEQKTEAVEYLRYIGSRLRGANWK
ncbi:MULTISPECIES: hypothetical protein [Pseudomonas]|uniref:hypothetical protein n=1 Tax=Pseudomonas TaxID=286 RepID=UPI0011AF0743|nr:MULTISPECIES: hypothetical protein [Pseudomonas]MBH3377136.1 hypothetical protein [Pseudomonas asiatica]MEE1914962.1 hypothetical protein [Pseudomonas asiatica]UXA36863.1 hypothetical protein KZA81_15195 [Pseudomonas juntendi]